MKDKRANCHSKYPEYLFNLNYMSIQMTSRSLNNPVSNVCCHNRQKYQGSVTRGRVAEVLITPTECLNCDPVTPENDGHNNIIFVCYKYAYLVSVIQSLWLIFLSPGVWQPHSIARINKNFWNRQQKKWGDWGILGMWEKALIIIDSPHLGHFMFSHFDRLECWSGDNQQ